MRPRHGDKLTEQELEVLVWAAEGKTAEETAIIIGMSAKTVTLRLAHAMAKLNAVNKTHAVAKAVRSELIV